MTPRTALPIRRAAGEPLHLAKPTGRGYRTACGRSLRGPKLELAHTPWARAWRLELVCPECEAKRRRATDEAHLARLAGW